MLQKLFFLLYGLLWAIAKPLLKKHKRLREGYEERIIGGAWQNLAEKEPVSIWIQAASGGEAYLTLALLKYLTKEHEEHGHLHILCTSMTRQGMEVLQKGKSAFETAWQEKQKGKCPEISFCYFPFDDKKSMEKAFALARPKICILLETELWPNFMRLCKDMKSLLYVVNARMNEKTYKAYRKIKTIFAGYNPDIIFATRQKDKEYYQEIFAQSRCEFMHNIKFDTVYQELCLAMQAKNENSLQKVFAPKLCVYLFASVRQEEEPELLPLVEKLHTAKTKSVFCIVPRHVARFGKWKKALQGKGLPVRFASELFEKNAQMQAQDIVIWDRFGDLKELYALADYVFVGGSLVPLGGQNFLEALVYGRIPHTGVHLHNFLWTFEMQNGAKNLAEENLLCLHENFAMLAETFLALPEEKFTQHTKIQERFKIWLKPLIGDTKKIMDEILEKV